MTSAVSSCCIAFSPSFVAPPPKYHDDNDDFSDHNCGDADYDHDGQHNAVVDIEVVKNLDRSSFLS